MSIYIGRLIGVRVGILKNDSHIVSFFLSQSCLVHGKIAQSTSIVPLLLLNMSYNLWVNDNTPLSFATLILSCAPVRASRACTADFFSEEFTNAKLFFTTDFRMLDCLDRHIQSYSQPVQVHSRKGATGAVVLGLYSEAVSLEANSFLLRLAAGLILRGPSPTTTPVRTSHGGLLLGHLY